MFSLNMTPVNYGAARLSAGMVSLLLATIPLFIAILEEWVGMAIVLASVAAVIPSDVGNAKKPLALLQPQTSNGRAGAYLKACALALHFCAISGSNRALINTPPTTDRA